ncbi:MAG TPA: EAL domain-containing protein [Holophagaceae bacterium]|nr:EAL domain-containing protein [Holophagaceae bacterium]HJW72278.1 EAL domain-containing protein [Geothrix sp.]
MSAPVTSKDASPVLCVEDDAASRLLLVRILEERFSRVLVARDGAEGLDLFCQHHPTLVITDIEMPGMDGIAMARAIKAVAPATHIIVTTFFEETELILSAVDVGVIDYVLKPVLPARLNAAIDKCFRVATLERELRHSKLRTEQILESISDAFFALDHDWCFTYVNRKAEDYFRATRSALLGRSYRDMVSDQAETLKAVEAALTTREKRTLEQYSPGAKVWHELNIFPLDGGISVYLKNITERKQHEDEIKFLAFYDPLTELPNRTLLQDRLNRAILRCKRKGERGAVLFLDLDRFKNINDTLGHQAGDLVLKEVAKRLHSCLRDTDTVARLGGDEFIILLEGFDHPESIHSITHRLLFALAQDISHLGLTLSITCSIGISFFPSDGETVEDLLKASDTAMYHGKSLGRNNYQFYSPEMNQENLNYLAMESALRKSVQNHDFIVHYQPQVNLRSGAILGFEALVRWNHPVKGLVSPDQFIPIAEDTGLILLLGDWVLETACAQARAWMDLHPEPFRMAVNLSGRQFWQGDLVDSIARSLTQSGLPPEYLELEITESMVMREVDVAIDKMRELASMGIHLSMDDFGTGYSSLAVLKQFPIQSLKIDKSFVRDVTTNANDAAISAAILALAHSMNLTVVAEGLETQEQVVFFRGRDCEIGQGFYFSRPVPAGEAESLFLRSALEVPGGR